MHVTIVGPGALGCLHAARLARAGVPVNLLDHRPERARLIAERGIILEEGDTSSAVPVACAASAETLPQAGLVLFCVKTFQTEAAAAHARPLVGPETLVLRIQNGLAPPDCLLALAAPERIVLGTSGHGANALGWGHVRHAGSGPTRIGPLVPEGLASAHAVADALRPALPEVEVFEDVQPVLWRKLLANAAVNPLTAITGLRNGQLLEVPLLRAALRDLATEAERVAIARGMAFTGGQAALAAEEACRRTAENRSSMLQDVERGRSTEIDDICGAVAREAAAAGVEAPLSQLMTWLVAEVLQQGATKARRS
jgi:2-dehydropantoate 2-reductase